MSKIRFAWIDPAAQRISFIGAAALPEALALAGLKPGEVDHGSLGGGLSIVVYEFGLLDSSPAGLPIPPQRYFSLGPHLYAGPAVIFAFDEAGETVDVTVDSLAVVHSVIRWYADKTAALAAIEAGEVHRPQITITAGGNVDKVWEFA